MINPNNLSVSIVGRVRVITRDVHTGKETLVVEEKNQLTYVFLSNVTRLLVQKPSDLATLTTAWRDISLHSIHIEASETPLALIPAPDQTEPEGEIVYRHVLAPDTEKATDLGGVPGILELKMTIPTDQANGKILRAAALYTRGDNDDPVLSTTKQLCARRLMGAIEKSADIEVDVYWRIEFALG